MSFFGFDPSLRRDRGHNPGAPGFSQAADPFAGLSRPDNDDDDDDALDFEDTYDGLGDKLDETDDVFNDDTFGGEESGSKKPVGKDFDFSGQTAKVADAISEEYMRYTRQQPAPKAAPATNASFGPQSYSKPQKSGYERYKEPGYLEDLRADDDLWGTGPKSSSNVQAQSASQAASTTAPAGRKMMSLEEVEAAMRAQAKKPAQTEAPPQQHQPQPLPQHVPQPQHYQQPPQPQFQQNEFGNMQFQHHPQGPQFQQYPHPHPSQQQFVQPAQGFPSHHQETQRHAPPPPQQQPIHILQRPQGPSPKVHTPPATQSQPPHIQILQNPNRLSGEHQRPPHVPTSQPTQTIPTGPGPIPPIPGVPHGPGHRHSTSVITHPQQLAGLSEEERAAYLLEEAKRAKRNHKIFLLSKDNGLMTPQDKNFITRIQLQQLVTATGNPNEHGSDASLSEDFYYQVHNQIRGGPRQHPNQPLSNFAQTYLFQTGGRHGGMRRQARGGDNHMQRMEQQVQRAVEAAKNKPKNKQLVIEGSLGKISFSNAKTPKPLLNIKRADNEAARASHQSAISGDDRKTVLRDIENVYNSLMQMEDHDRSRPPPLTEDVNPTLVGQHLDWTEKQESLNRKLWEELKVHAPIGATATHPFIAFLSFSKGKKAIPRIFRHITQEQRTTIFTMIVVHLDQLDVVRNALLAPGELQLNTSIRENVELFSLAVMPSLFGFLNEVGLDIVDGVLGLIVTRTRLEIVARTRIGVSMLTMILSRAELIKQGGAAVEAEWERWLSTYNAFFDVLEPVLPYIFPGTVSTGEDVYVWQFLAAIGVGASPEQQQRLVMAVKDRVMETVALAKTLPPAMSSQRLANVNLFMRSIGLDVELLA